MNLELPDNPTDEELARDWTLSPEDLHEIRQCRGGDNRHRFALQLCSLRVRGRFVKKYDEAPVRIVNHLGAQLDRPAVLFLEPSDRPATESRHAHHIREYLGSEPFSEATSTRLADALEQAARRGSGTSALMVLAAETLFRWRVERPAPSTLRRIVGSVTEIAGEAAWTDLHDRVPLPLRKSMDTLLEVPEGEANRSDKLYPTLLAALVAHGTNLGVSTMAQSAPGITVDSLQHVSRWFTDEETLKAASRRIVEYHHGLDLSAVWGDGTVSSSDGQRFQVDSFDELRLLEPRHRSVTTLELGPGEPIAVFEPQRRVVETPWLSDLGRRGHLPETPSSRFRRLKLESIFSYSAVGHCSTGDSSRSWPAKVATTAASSPGSLCAR